MLQEKTLRKTRDPALLRKRVLCALLRVDQRGVVDRQHAVLLRGGVDISRRQERFRRCAGRIVCMETRQKEDLSAQEKSLKKSKPGVNNCLLFYDKWCIIVPVVGYRSVVESRCQSQAKRST